MALLTGLKPTKQQGVFYKEHDTRKHGVIKDRQLVLRFTVRCKAYVEPFGWISEGKTELDAAVKIAEFKANGKRPDCTGPFCLADERAALEAIENARKLEEEGKQPFKTLAKEYLAGLTLRPKTLRAYRDGLAIAAAYKPAKGLPKIGDTLVADISKRHLAQCIEATAKKSPSTAVSMRSTLSAFFTWLAGPSREYIEVNFVPAIPKPKANTPRERTLTNDEIIILWRHLDDDSSNHLTNLIKFLFLTGCRLSEALKMEKGEIDGQWWTIPGNRTKGKRPHRIFLTQSALALLGDRQQPFSNPLSRRRAGEKKATPKPYSSSSVNHYLTRKEWFGLPRFSAHDARRTVGSGLALLGFVTDTIAAVLSHKLPGVTQQHYLRHDQDPEKKRAWLAWEQHIIKITAGATAKVVNLNDWR